MKFLKLLFLLLLNYPSFSQDSRFTSYEIDPINQELKFYWKDSLNHNYSNFEKLITSLAKENKKLIFAMNGGMYLKDQSPQGLYIENGIVKSKIDEKDKGYGNFYLQPNGIFFITKDDKAFVCVTEKFSENSTIKYATQSGPMLVIDGKLHPKFNLGSPNVHKRNGVGILPNGNILFAISKEKVNFYDFATYFKHKGCKNALYLDGFVSRMYLPLKDWKQLDGKFGVIIGVTKTINND